MGGEQGGEEMHQRPRPEQLQPGLLGDTGLEKKRIEKERKKL